MQRKLVQGPVPTTPPSFTTPQISTTVAANSQPGQEGFCLQLPWPGLSPHSTTGRFKSSLFCKCAVAHFPLLESFSDWRQLHVSWAPLVTHPAPLKGCGCQSLSSNSLPSSFLLFFVACPAFAQGTVPWRFPSFPLLGACGISAMGHTGSCAFRAPPAQPSFAAHQVFLTTEGK